MGEDGDGIELPDALEGKTLGTVAELNTQVSRVVSSIEPEFDYIIGDVTDTNQAGGNYYFDIQDNDNKINCLIFNYERVTLPDFDEGDRVAVSGRLNYYEKGGSVSLIINEVYLVGASLYHKRIKEIASELEDLGAFDEETKRTLPVLPRTIGIVTARDSDAEQDAINSIRNRFSDVNIVLSDVKVQGDQAPEDIVGAVVEFENRDDIDVIVITRGGGSETALHPFNMKGVCMIAHNTSTPVVSAIGHENDTPLLDRAADARAMTPTDIGETIIINKDEWVDSVSEYQQRISGTYERLVQQTLETHADTVHSAYRTHVSRTVDQLSQDVTKSYASLWRERVQSLSHTVSKTYKQYVTQYTTSLRNQVSRRYESFEQEVKHEQETRGIRKREQRYKYAVVALVILLLVILGVVVFTVL